MRLFVASLIVSLTVNSLSFADDPNVAKLLTHPDPDSRAAGEKLLRQMSKEDINKNTELLAYMKRLMDGFKHERAEAIRLLDIMNAPYEFSSKLLLSSSMSEAKSAREKLIASATQRQIEADVPLFNHFRKLLQGNNAQVNEGLRLLETAKASYEYKAPLLDLAFESRAIPETKQLAFEQAVALGAPKRIHESLAENILKHVKSRISNPQIALLKSYELAEAGIVSREQAVRANTTAALPVRIEFPVQAEEKKDLLVTAPKAQMSEDERSILMGPATHLKTLVWKANNPIDINEAIEAKLEANATVESLKRPALYKLSPTEIVAMMSHPKEKIRTLGAQMGKALKAADFTVDQILDMANNRGGKAVVGVTLLPKIADKLEHNPRFFRQLQEEMAAEDKDSQLSALRRMEYAQMPASFRSPFITAALRSPFHEVRKSALQTSAKIFTGPKTELHRDAVLELATAKTATVNEQPEAEKVLNHWINNKSVKPAIIEAALVKNSEKPTKAEIDQMLRVFPQETEPFQRMATYAYANLKGPQAEEYLSRIAATPENLRFLINRLMLTENDKKAEAIAKKIRSWGNEAETLKILDEKLGAVTMKAPRQRVLRLFGNTIANSTQDAPRVAEKYPNFVAALRREGEALQVAVTLQKMKLGGARADVEALLLDPAHAHAASVALKSAFIKEEDSVLPKIPKDALDKKSEKFVFAHIKNLSSREAGNWAPMLAHIIRTSPRASSVKEAIYLVSKNPESWSYTDAKKMVKEMIALRDGKTVDVSDDFRTASPRLFDFITALRKTTRAAYVTDAALEHINEKGYSPLSDRAALAMKALVAHGVGSDEALAAATKALGNPLMSNKEIGTFIVSHLDLAGPKTQAALFDKMHSYPEGSAVNLFADNTLKFVQKFHPSFLTSATSDAVKWKATRAKALEILGQHAKFSNLVQLGKAAHQDQELRHEMQDSDSNRLQIAATLGHGIGGCVDAARAATGFTQNAIATTKGAVKNGFSKAASKVGSKLKQWSPFEISIKRKAPQASAPAPTTPSQALSKSMIRRPF